MLSSKNARSIFLILGYMFCFWFIRLVTLTVVAFSFLRNSDQSPLMLQKIGDVARANQIVTYGFSALIFLVTLQIMQPLSHTGIKTVLNLKELRKHFAPNALNGFILALVLIFGSLLGGHLSYLGIYMKFDEVIWSFVTAIFFGSCFFIFILTEEYIMRSILEPLLRTRFESIATLLISSAIYLIIKSRQFELGWVDALNFVILNLMLSLIAKMAGSFCASASFASAFGLCLHIVFGLPFMSQDMPGIFLMRASTEGDLSSWLSGGSAGPEAGVILTILLLVYLYLPQTGILAKMRLYK